MFSIAVLAENHSPAFSRLQFEWTEAVRKKDHAGFTAALRLDGVGVLDALNKSCPDCAKRHPHI